MFREANNIRSGDISPTGSRVVFDFRGDIITMPSEKGDPRNLTLTTNVHEKYPAWSPDGKTIAYFSDASGEYMLHLKPQDGKGDPKIIQASPAQGSMLFRSGHLTVKKYVMLTMAGIFIFLI